MFLLYDIIAFAIGWFDLDSRVLAILISSSSLTPTGFTDSRDGFPSVTVPVLSKIIVFDLFIASNTAAFLINMPSFALAPIDVTTATGVARPKEQGHDITRTCVACNSAAPISRVTINQISNVISDTSKTVGTNIELILSAIL